jgi:hypothetical protein
MLDLIDLIASPARRTRGLRPGRRCVELWRHAARDVRPSTVRQAWPAENVVGPLDRHVETPW